MAPGRHGGTGSTRRTVPSAGSGRGRCDPSYSNGSCVYGLGSTWITYRSYLNFNIPSSIWDSGFVDAQLQTNMEWAWACSPGTQVNLYYTDKATQGMTWPGPSASSPGGGACYYCYGPRLAGPRHGCADSSNT